MRLDKFLSHTGFGSRKEVKGILKTGIVRVNGNVEKNGQLLISEKVDTVCVNDEIVHYEKYFYYLLNKPKGVISATEDKQHQTVLDLFNKADIKKDLFPVGRLDKDTTGLLLVTNDGALAHNLLSPKKKIPKTYRAIVLGIMDETDIKSFKEGLEIDGGEVCLAAKLNIESVDIEKNQSSIQLEIYEGKYHQVKRMVKAVGKHVIELNRIGMGGLSLDDTLKKGEYRELSQEEISLIKNGYEKKL